MIAVPFGVCVRALSMRIRRICCLARSGSASGYRLLAAVDARARSRAARPPAANSPATSSAELRRGRRARGAGSIASASSLREVEQVGRELRQPVDLLAHRPHELAPRLGIGVLVLEQLDEAAQREDRRAQLVRGVGDELLRALSRRASRRCISLSVSARAGRPRRSSRPGSGSRKSPSATASAAASSRRSRRAWAPGGEPAGGERQQDRDRARRSGSGGGSARRCRRRRREVDREHGDPARPRRRRTRDRRRSRRSRRPSTRSTAIVTVPLDGRGAAPRVGGVDRVRSSSESATRSRAGPRGLARRRARVTRASACWPTERITRRSSACELRARASPRRCGRTPVGLRLLEPARASRRSGSSRAAGRRRGRRSRPPRS